MPGLNIPEGAGGALGRLGGINKKYLLSGLVLIALIAGMIWFFSTRSSNPGSTVTTTSTSTTTAPTPTPISISTLFSTIGTITIPNSGDPMAALQAAISNENPELGEVKVFHVVDDKNAPYPLDGFFGRLLLTLPATADTNVIKTTNWVLGVYGQQRDSSPDFVDTRVFILSEIGNSRSAAQDLLTAWNPSIIQSFAPIFGYDKSTKNQMVPDSYSGASFNYVRVPDKNLGLAESIVNKFLFFASSKDSFRSIVDLISKQ
jgi:hypothetical protein